jgi:hypothetical protein
MVLKPCGNSINETLRLTANHKTKLLNEYYLKGHCPDYVHACRHSYLLGCFLPLMDETLYLASYDSSNRVHPRDQVDFAESPLGSLVLRDCLVLHMHTIRTVSL